VSVNAQRLSRRANYALFVIWLAMVPVSVATGWIYSIAFVSAASIYANAATHWAAARSDANPREPEG
jgi:hypothetical protein